VADIVLTIPNEQIGRAIDALCTAGGYAGDPDDKAARRDFARRVVAQFVRDTVMQAERQKAVTDAMANVTVDPITID
jgi:hypothetical protein